MVCPGEIAESNTRNAISAFLKVALFESDIFHIVDKKCRPVVVLLESEAAVKKTDVPDVAEVPCISRNRSNFTGKVLVVLFGVQ